MTAPAAPSPSTAQNGKGVVRISWKAVPTATSYQVFLGSTPHPTSVTATVLSSAALSDGTFQYWAVRSTGAYTYVRMKAVNAGAEASAYSTEYQVNVHLDTNNTSSKALQHIKGT